MDLTRVKSTRACLPLAGAFPRQPRQARADFRKSGQVESPLPAGLRPSAFGPGKRPLDVCFRVLWRSAPIPYRNGFDNRPLPGSFEKAEDGDEGQSEMFGE
jgi:hypothetical protein